MSTDKTQTVWLWLGDRWRDSLPSFSRFFKYLFLVIALLSTTKIVFDGYSYYVARRGIDAELDSQKISSLEYLKVLQQRERALMRETMQTRCTERIEIALFRIFNVLNESKLKLLSDYYKQTLDLKDLLVIKIKEDGPKFLDRWEDSVHYVNSATFIVAEFKEKYLKKLATVNETDPAYRDFDRAITEHLNTYNNLVLSNPDLQKFAAEAQDEANHHWHLEAVRTLEARLTRLKEERAAIRGGANLDGILARYAVWSDALAGRSGVGELPTKWRSKLIGKIEPHLLR